MVLGIITAVAACPGIIGTTEAVRQGQRQNVKEKHRGLKTNLVVSCSGTQDGSQEVHGRSVVLHNNKLYINTPSLPKSTIKPHPFAGYFLPHPSHSWRRLGEGLVSTISDDPPQLNWIYVDTNTHEVKYGYRVDCEGQLVGPWNVTPVGKRLTLEGWEGFIALEEIRGSGIWEVAFDRDADGLMEVGCAGMRMVPIELERREMRVQRPEWAKSKQVEKEQEEHKEVEVEYEIVDEDEKKGAGEASDGRMEA